MFLNVFSVCVTLLSPTEGSKGTASYGRKGSSMGAEGPQVFLASCGSGVLGEGTMVGGVWTGVTVRRQKHLGGNH